MNKWTILVTDSLFVYKEHEEKLKKAWYDIERLDKPEASEIELIEALQWKVWYIFGWVEMVTTKVFESVKDLKVLAMTVSDWKHFAPWYETAFSKNILISNAPWANSYAVAEYSLAGLLQLSRNLTSLWRWGNKKFQTSKSIAEMTIWIIWMWNIGSTFARMLKWLWVKKIMYFSKTRKEELESELWIEYAELDNICKMSDVISSFIPSNQWTYIKGEQFNLMKEGMIILNCWSENFVDRDAMYKNIVSWKVRVFQDHNIDEERFHQLPKENWANSNMSTAYNTFEANKKASDIVTESIINLLEKATDKYMVNY